MNYLSPFEELPMSITLHKVNKNIFGENIIELDTKNKLFDYLVSPLEVNFFRVETDLFEESNIIYGDIIIVERTPLKTDGLAIVRIENQLLIREIAHNKEFNTILKNSNERFEFFGTITYVIRSEEEDFINMLSEELFFVS